MRAISGPGDLAPAQDQGGIGETGAGKGGMPAGPDASPPTAAARPRRGGGSSALPVVLGRRSGHGRQYAARSQSEKARNGARSGGAPAGLVRPPPPRAALARAQRQARRSLSGLAFGNHAAADHGAGGGRLLPQIPGTLAGCEGAGGGASRTMCWPPGRGLAITPAPAICMPPPRSWRARWAANFPPPRKACARCRASAAIPSGAIAAIAYDERQAAMDANAERVIARLYAVETPMPKAKTELHAHGQALVPERAGDFAQALMDLGSAICTPKRPACAQLSVDGGLPGAQARHPGTACRSRRPRCARP